MAVYKDEEGNEVEGLLSAEEVEAKVAEANAAKEAELAEVKAALEAEKAKEKNFEALRAKAADAGKTKEAVEAEYKTKLDELDAKFNNLTQAQKLQSLAEKEAGGDAELAEKILVHYNNFKVDNTNVDKMKEAMTNAAILAGAGVGNRTTMNAGVISSTGGNAPKPPAVGDLTPELKDMAKKFGFTEEQLK